MNPPKPIKQLLPLPIASYLVGFFSVAALLFALVVSWMTGQSNEITQLANENRLQSAQQEIHKATKLVEEELQRITIRLSLWEEVYQQLGDPTFYEYWRSNRALRAGQTPSYIEAIELYNARGQQLLPNPNSGMPKQRPNPDLIIRIENERPYLYTYSLVSKKGDATKVLGYIGVKLDFHQALLDLNRFIYVDAQSIRYPSATIHIADIDDLLLRTRFKAMPIAETQQLEELMNSTLIKLSALSFLLLIIAYFLTSYLLHSPLRALANYIDELRRGNTDGNQVPVNQKFCVKEFEVLRNSIVSYQLELEQMHSSLDQKNMELWKLAHHDALTGIPNRRAYEEDWRKLQQLVRGQRIALSFILLDVDHFKAINDSYGHDVGDQVLQTVGSALQQVLREGDHLYRLGGDEFAMHLLNTDHNEAEQFANLCRQRLEQTDFKEIGIREPVRFSIGLASAIGSDALLLSQLHKHADVAMYQAKRPGSNRIVTYSAALETSAEALTSNRFINAIYQAIENEAGIELHFQPVLDIQGEHPSFHEVLLRLRDGEGQIGPANIFPIIETEGLSVELDFAIIKHLAARLLKHGEELGRLSINIDGATLMHHSFMQRVKLLIPYLQQLPQGIILEITETALISELKEASNRLKQLRELGFAIALDDFGSGYSSLRYLASMPVDIVKFDINLIRDLESKTGQAEITADMARIIRKIGYQLVAEGIESETLLNKVQALGFTHVQGFLFGRPSAHTVKLSQLETQARQPGGEISPVPTARFNAPQQH